MDGAQASEGGRSAVVEFHGAGATVHTGDRVARVGVLAQLSNMSTWASGMREAKQSSSVLLTD